MKTKFAKIKPVFFAGLMVLSVLLAVAPSRGAAFSGEGEGTVQSPYLISNCDELQSIGSNAEAITGSVYWLTNNIDCSGIANFLPIQEFGGVFDGRNYTISNLTVDRPTESYVALFASTSSGALIANVTLDSSNSFTGSYGAASIVGNAEYSTLRYVHSAATVTAEGNLAGGLVGESIGWENDMVIEESSFTGTVVTGDWAGGIIGRAVYGYTIQNVVSDAEISGYALGGVIGRSADACGYRYINNTIVRGTITGDSYIGGLVGEYQNNTCHVQQVTNSVSLATLSGTGVVGGIIGRLNNANITLANTFFDTTTAGTTDCTGEIAAGSVSSCSAIGTNAAPGDEPYVQWDFTDIWQETSGLVNLRMPHPLLSGPDAPDGLTVEEGDQINNIVVSWEEPASFGSFSAENYMVQIKEADVSWDRYFDYSSTSDLTTNFNGLKLGTAYTLRIQSRTQYGGSQWIEASYTTPEPNVYTATNCQELQDFDTVGSYLDVYELTNDIDCSDVENFSPLSWSDSFGGVLDGNGHTIYNLNIQDDDNYYYGLIETTNQAIIRDVIIDSGTLTVTGDSGYCGALAGEMYDTSLSAVVVRNYSVSCGYNVGGIAGYVDVDGNNLLVEVEEAQVTNGDIYGMGNVGGLFGEINVDEESELKVIRSSSNASVTSEDYTAGGLAGLVYVENDDDDNSPSSFTVVDSYTSGVITSDYNAGGIIGEAEVYNDEYDAEAQIEVENSYSTAIVTAYEDSAGGIIGYMDGLDYDGESIILGNVFVAGTVSATNGYDYALVGGADGIDEGELRFTEAYFDQTVTGQSEASNYELEGWTAVNSDGLDAQYFMANSVNPPLDQWDFDGVWNVTAEYPCLRAIDEGCQEEGNNVPYDDLNGDGIVDAEQPNIGGYRSPVTGKLVAMDMGENCELTTDDMAVEVNLPVSDVAYEYDNGLFDFAADCTVATTQIKLYYYDVAPAGLVARKFSTRINGYFNLDDAVITTQSINGHSVTVVSYQLTDNSERDMDLEPGSIEDPAGLARSILTSPNTGLNRSE